MGFVFVMLFLVMGLSFFFFCFVLEIGICDIEN